MSSDELESDYTDMSENECDKDSSSDDEVSSSSSDSEKVDLSAARNWYAISTINPPPRPPRFDFIAESTLNFETNKDVCKDVMKFIKLFLDDDFFEIVVRETNKQAIKMAVPNWKLVNNDEMKVFLVVNILMVLVKKANIQHYWTKRHIIETPIFFKIMHFNDDEDFDNKTPCAKTL